MLPKTSRVIPWIFVLFAVACSSKKSGDESAADTLSAVGETAGESVQPAYVYDGENYADLDYEEIKRNLPPLDLQQDLSNKTLEELRLLRNTIPARYGYLFMKADLRDYFGQTSWYRPLMEARWYGDCEYSGLAPAPPIEYTDEEKAFLQNVQAMEAARLKENYIVKDGKKYPNIKNLVNRWQYSQMPGALMDKLAQHAYAIVPNNNVQLFHVYEQNDYSQAQNFVTTDAFLQLFHMHFSFMLRGLEEDTFVPMLGEMLGAMQRKYHTLANDPDAKVKAAAAYNEAMYAVPLAILSGNTPDVSKNYQPVVADELQAISEAVALPSVLLKAYAKNEFPYDMFKPRGHYTRTDTLQRYFKAMQWLQLAPYCFMDNEDLERAVVAAHVLNTTKAGSKNVVDLYAGILQPTTFLVGAPDNVSLMDLCDILKKKAGRPLAGLLAPDGLGEIRSELAAVAATKNRIKPKVELTCPDKINFMPARFVLDNEVLQEMTDIDERPYPKGLDVMAAFGSDAAERMLTGFHKEDKAWDKFLPNLEKMKAKYKNFEDWNETVYAKWIRSLTAMLKKDARYPYFMQLDSWNKKNLNTALASWAELKHDAILYTEQPMAAECGDGGDCMPPPEPYVTGYVEPNVNLWKEALELLDITENMMKTHGLLANPLRYKQERLRELCQFLLQVSEKELAGETLSEQEYRTIELIGTSMESLTLSIVGTDSWELVHGPDKEVAVVADVYTHNVGEKAGILHAAVGYVNDLYVVVEIDGYLYLTRGATFSYYEFPMPLNNRLTDEAWQEMLHKGKVYPVPAWMNDVIIELDAKHKPEITEYIYSSGC